MQFLEVVLMQLTMEQEQEPLVNQSIIMLWGVGMGIYHLLMEKIMEYAVNLLRLILVTLMEPEVDMK